MPDLSAVVPLIKRVAVQAVQAGSPSTVMYGTVTSKSPLKIKLDQGLTLEGDQITVPEHLTDYTVDIEILEYPVTDVVEEHAHGLSKVKKIKILNHLKSGQRVAVQRMEGGQEFCIIDRLPPGSTGGGCGT